jgi:hypothetical protein
MLIFRGTARIGLKAAPVSHPGAPCSLSPQLQMPNIGYSFFSWILEGTEYLWMGTCVELQPDGYIWKGTDGKL